VSSKLINRTSARIFRITHIANVPWILDHGLHCRSSSQRDPGFVDIGNPDLIRKRNHRDLPVSPGGTLSDYVPFYFTPWSPMLYNIKTGYQGVTQRPMSDIVIMVSSVPRLDQIGARYVISDRHAYLQTAQFAGDATGLRLVDWSLLQARNFRRDPEHPERFDHYQAEALVHQHLPCAALLGIVCHGEPQRAGLESLLRQRGSSLKLVAQSDMFF
jgi:hypothetical protein